MKTTPFLLITILVTGIVLTPFSTQAGPFDFGKFYKKYVYDDPKERERQALEQSGIAREERLAQESKEPVVSTAVHLANVKKALNADVASYTSSVGVQNDLAKNRKNTAPGSAERRKIDKELIRLSKQNAALLRDIKNNGGDPAAVKRSVQRGLTPVSDDAADVFLPGFGGAWLGRNAASRSRRDAQRAAQNAGRSGGAPGRIVHTPASVSTPIKKPRRVRRARPGHNPAEGAHH